MSTEESASPILAAFEAGSPRREAIDFALVASRITGAPLVAVTVTRSGPMVEAMSGGGVQDTPGEAGRSVEHVRRELRERGVRFIETGGVHSDPRGALTESQLGGVMFELVHDERAA